MVWLEQTRSYAIAALIGLVLFGAIGLAACGNDSAAESSSEGTVAQAAQDDASASESGASDASNADDADTDSAAAESDDASGTGESGESAESATTAEAASDDCEAKYASVIQAYATAMESDGEPDASVVNPEAWMARKEVADSLSYAMRDLDGDGAAELLVASVIGQATGYPGLEVTYRVYDIYSLRDGELIRALDDADRGSLGYRAFCIPCEGGLVATGGSGGATNYGIFYKKLEAGVVPSDAVESVVVDGDAYTFTDAEGNETVLTGAAGQAELEALTARYHPLDDFDWKPVGFRA